MRLRWLMFSFAILQGCGGCPEGTTACGGYCASLDTDFNCGTCGNDCRVGTECRAGRCECVPGLTPCGGRCLDLQSNVNDCGACGTSCPMGASCRGGICECPDTMPDACGDSCVSLATDSGNCGECGLLCTGATVCSGGVCGCSDPTQSVCGDGCVDLQTDPTHCGACDAACETECVGGVCLRFRELVVGGSHSCLILEDDRVACWGSNNHGRLNPAWTQLRVNHPVIVAGVEVDAGSQLSLGYHSCTLIAGEVRCWGNNLYGAVDPSDPAETRVGPVTVTGIPAAAQLLAGDGFTCILDAAGAPTCWGNGNLISASSGTLPPGPWGVATDLTALVGLGVPCGMASDGTVPCDTFQGGGTGDYPAPVDGWEGAIALAVDRYHGCAVFPDGRVHCRGSNSHGQIGTGGTNDSLAFITSDVPLPLPATDVAVGRLHSCALLTDGRVYCWGNSRYGQSGTLASAVLEPRAISGAEGTIDLQCGGDHCCIWRGANDVRCWGENNSGAVGDSSFEDRWVATPLDLRDLRR